MKDKKILILGGSGFIGAHLTKRLIHEEALVTVLCRDPKELQNIEAYQNARLLNGDITHYDDVASAIKDADIIVNLATVVQTTKTFDPYTDFNVNLKGQINVLEARKNVNPHATYIYIGSSMQFGQVKEEHLPVAENHPQKPISLYGVHKVAAEEYCYIYEKAHGLPSIIVRFPPIYGPSLTGKPTRSVIEKFVKMALNSETFHVYSHGSDRKDLIYIDDVVEVLIKLMAIPEKKGVYNAGSGTQVLFSEVAQMIVDESGSGNFILMPSPDEFKGFDIGSFYFDISKIKHELGWTPKIDIREGLKRMISFYKNK
ncbi:MAG: NAD-dependent epimerase/dehydratase family protein [Patescibacteria group bacterium]